MNFASHLDDAIAASAALVNVATGGHRRGRPYAVPSGPELRDELVTALRVGSLREPAPPARLLADFVALAAAVRPVFEQLDAGRLDAAARTVNGLLQRYRPTPFLEKHGDAPWHLHFHGPAGHDPTEWGGAVATGLATVIGSDYTDRLGVCAAPACDRVFVDVSRNGTRRFCSEACQNRVKAAAHRARRRT